MSYDVDTRRLPLFALFDLKGPHDALTDWAPDLGPLPKTPNQLIHKEEILLCHIGPDHWLLRAPLTQEAALETALRPADAPPAISVIRISDTLSFFRLTGTAAGEVLSIGCPLDLHDSVFGPDAVTFTEMFGLKALVLRVAGGFEFAVDQSYGDMIEDYLARALR